MPITLSPLPPLFSPVYVDNFPPVTFSGIDPEEGMPLTLNFSYTGGGGTYFPILEEIIMPDAQGDATLQFRHAINTVLQNNYPVEEVSSQQNASGWLRIEFDVASVYTLVVVKGGINIPPEQFASFDYSTFFTQNFLSWMPPNRIVKKDEPFYLNYFNKTAGANLYAVVYTKNQAGATQTSNHTLSSSIPTDRITTFSYTFTALATKTSTPNALAIDIFVGTGVNTQLSNKFRYTLTNEYDEYDDIFIFDNSLGGIETIRFTGEMMRAQEHETDTYRMWTKETIEFQSHYREVFSKHTGYTDTQAGINWYNEFLSATLRYHLATVNSTTLYNRIFVMEQTAEARKYNLNSYHFLFAYAKEARPQLHQRPPLKQFDPTAQIFSKQ